MKTSAAHEGVRERKRRETRQRIIDEATNLVEAHGFDAVTVEDICAAANISRRTFFNYMECKDEAVLGTLPFKLTSTSFEMIEHTQSSNVLDLIIDAMEETAVAADPERLARRFAIVSANSTLANAAHAGKREVAHALRLAVEKHFERFPEDRRLPGPVDEEVLVVVEVFESCVRTYLHSPTLIRKGSPRETIRDVARNITTYAKELRW